MTNEIYQAHTVFNKHVWKEIGKVKTYKNNCIYYCKSCGAFGEEIQPNIKEIDITHIGINSLWYIDFIKLLKRKQLTKKFVNYLTCLQEQCKEMSLKKLLISNWIINLKYNK